MSHLGIDLGTTFSLAAHLNAQGIPTLFPDMYDANQFRTPSVAILGEDVCFVGALAENAEEDEPGVGVIRHVKLALGTDQIWQDEAGREWRAETISALYLKKLARDVEAHTQEEIEHLVITVPANFSDAQRRATKHAALLAGLPNPTLVEEPVAAATFYGVEKARGDNTIFTYDLGGGTFDATIVQSSPDGLYALATEGRNDVGGKAVNEALIAFVAAEFKAMHGYDPLTDPTGYPVMNRFAEEAKIALSRPGLGQFRKTLAISGRMMELVITRTQFEKLITPIVEKTFGVCDSVLNRVGFSWGEMDKILLAGGSTFLPMVSSLLRERAGANSRNFVTNQPHHAVAYGAALIAAQLAGKATRVPQLHRNLTATDLGIRVWNKETNSADLKVLIPSNTPLPAKYKHTFYTNRPDQTRLIIELVQRNAGDPMGQSLGYFAFGPLANPRKNLPLEVTISCDMEGLVQVSAMQPDTGREIKHTVGGPDGEIVNWFNEQKELIDSVRINE